MTAHYRRLERARVTASGEATETTDLFLKWLFEHCNDWAEMTSLDAALIEASLLLDGYPVRDLKERKAR